MFRSSEHVCLVNMLQKDAYYRYLLDGPYDKDADPPLMYGATNTTIYSGFKIQCATPHRDFVSIEGYMLVVSIFEDWKKIK